MKHYEAHRYPMPPWARVTGEETKSGWTEPEEGCKLVAVFPDAASIVVVYEVPGASEEAVAWFVDGVAEEVGWRKSGFRGQSSDRVPSREKQKTPDSAWLPTPAR